MNITKKRLKQIIKEEIDSISEQDAQAQAQNYGGDIKRLMADPKVNQLASQVADKVGKLSSTQKAVVAAAILTKMGFSPEDLEAIKSMIGKQMGTAEEPAPAEEA
tara:strand:+ start:2450 stop:2764 length:315 start_codon:yes stop_codon:yes gene_type:complete